MNPDLWCLFRCLQTHPEHVLWKPLWLSALEEGCGDLESFRDLMRERECPLPELLRQVADEWAVARQEARDLLQRGVHLWVYGGPAFPECFQRMGDPPLTLAVWGGTDGFGQAGLSVVGSRDPSEKSLEWMEKELSIFCRQNPLTIVSGGARGIDQKAHSVAIRTGRPTIVFLPSGLNHLYPTNLRDWVKPVLDGGGCFVSEYPASSPMWKAHFHHRNRLIAAAGIVTLIVEARARSGTLITATRAAEMGRPLMVVPGHAGDPRFTGSLELIIEGGTMVRQSEDLTLFWQSEIQHQIPYGVAIVPAGNDLH